MSYSDADMLYNAAAGGAAIGAAAAGIYFLVGLAMLIVSLIGMWKVFVKAGKPGWGAIVPFYNLYCLFDMSFGNGWLFLLTFVPCVNAVMAIILCFKLAKAFGQEWYFALGLIFFDFIFMMILGFGNAEYIGPNN